MNFTRELVLSPEEAFNEELFQHAALDQLGLPGDGTLVVRPMKRSIDARGKNVVVRFQVEVVEAGANAPAVRYRKEYPDVSHAPEVVIIGAGPAGLFAALRLMEAGLRPVVLERGKDVQARRRDLAAINKEHVVNPDSNYCFGEGGAGTYSDGKLYTRSKKRGDVQRVLEILHAHGAPDDILFDAHPHIGTNKLPKVVSDLRETILSHGGVVRFNTKVQDLAVKDGEVTGVITSDGQRIDAGAIILATGHSARDIFELLHRREIKIEAKPFALGVRAEHDQSLIDKIQYHTNGDRGPWLPASSYALVHQATVKGTNRGVFSFCMCPGGFIVPAATAPGENVVNGMSPSRRDSRFANSGIVLAVDENDFKPYADFGPLAGMKFQEAIERRACEMAGGTQKAPAQRIVDFVEGKISSALNETSYQPGLTSVNMKDVLPDFVSEGLRQGFREFGLKMKGYFTNDAQIIGVESRTSSPVRVPRDKQTLEHIITKRLFPCGEGAGYAGGIVSAAMDGERCAEAVQQLYFKKHKFKEEIES